MATQTRTNWSRRQFLKAMMAAGLGLAGWSLLERYTLRLEEVSVVLPGLPPDADGLKIAFLTDIHVGNHAGPELAERAAALAARARPDLVLLGGDLIHDGTATSDLRAAAAALGRLHAPLGRYSILGNHDYAAGEGRIEAALADNGIHLLVNQGRRLRVRGHDLWLAGIDDCWNGRPSLQQALRQAPGGAARLLLVHEPDFADDAVRELGAEAPLLQLSGHSHGGQIRLPLVGAPYLPYMAQRYPIGLQRAEASAMQVYTSRGIGVTGPPARLFCPPEVTLLTLRRG